MGIYDNIGTPTFASRGFVPMAVEAGIVPVIQSLISGLAVNQRTLLLNLKSALEGSNAELAAALNMDNLRAIVAYMEAADLGITTGNTLPTMLNENGPVSVSAARDGGVATQVNVTYTEPPVDYTAEIYLDGVYQKESTELPSAGFVNDNIQGVADDAQQHNIRVLYRDLDGNITRFGQVATFT